MPGQGEHRRRGRPVEGGQIFQRGHHDVPVTLSGGSLGLARPEGDVSLSACLVQPCFDPPLARKGGLQSLEPFYGFGPAFGEKGTQCVSPLGIGQQVPPPDGYLRRSRRLLLMNTGGHPLCPARFCVGFGVKDKNIGQGAVYVGIQVAASAEHLQHVSSAATLLGVRRALRGLQLDQDLMLLLLCQRLRLTHLLHQIGQVRKWGGWGFG